MGSTELLIEIGPTGFSIRIERYEDWTSKITLTHGVAMFYLKRNLGMCWNSYDILIFKTNKNPNLIHDKEGYRGLSAKRL